MSIHEKVDNIMEERKRLLHNQTRREQFNDTMCRLRQAEEDLNKALCDIFEAYIQKETPTEPIQSKAPRYGIGTVYHDWICPTCEWFLAYEPDIRNIPKRCPCCGQLLKKVEEKTDE